MNTLASKQILNIAQLYADACSGCNKVKVGSAICNDGRIVALGANRAEPNLCYVRGCLRVELYGNDSKSHRNPEDCRAIHSEIDAICNAAKEGARLHGSSIYVTRYPCESCAKAIIAAGIKTVVYGGTTKISEQTRDIFERNNIQYQFVTDWKEDNSDR